MSPNMRRARAIELARKIDDKNPANWIPIDKFDEYLEMKDKG